ncbi:hypothetical protein Q1W73_15550 [Asticcacaulis sp. ZE23SCel15]|uniref:hypothetical protein n=1 Tax=Asticcacaulis sp. ZE23SCel15 TaxID=3059027 RepID=UPI00265DB33E|nr:hypothetical protein [Asticcacaulis sp. ZE23SCel15]WKL57060.1 hypothetical protein Q1W73_15550 [Asticcacaulis sp. ZE23SCel15]
MIFSKETKSIFAFSSAIDELREGVCEKNQKKSFQFLRENLDEIFQKIPDLNKFDYDYWKSVMDMRLFIAKTDEVFSSMESILTELTINYNKWNSLEAPSITPLYILLMKIVYTYNGVVECDGAKNFKVIPEYGQHKIYGVQDGESLLITLFLKKKIEKTSKGIIRYFEFLNMISSFPNDMAKEVDLFCQKFDEEYKPNSDRGLDYVSSAAFVRPLIIRKPNKSFKVPMLIILLAVALLIGFALIKPKNNTSSYESLSENSNPTAYEQCLPKCQPPFNRCLENADPDKQSELNVCSSGLDACLQECIY